MIKTISILEISRNGGTQPRGMIDMVTVQQYADEIKEGANFPAVTVFYDGSTYWLADGFHRTKAHEEAGKTEILANVHQGDQRDAILHSLGANSTHGLRRSNADKQRAIRRLLLDPEWTSWSDRRIGQIVRCSHKTVGAARRRLQQSGEIPTINTRKTAGGRVIDTSAIGSNQKEKPIAEPKLLIEEETEETEKTTGEFPSQSDLVPLVLVEDETPVVNDELIREELKRHIDPDGRFTFRGATTDFLQGVAEQFGAPYQEVSQIWFDIRFGSSWRKAGASTHQLTEEPNEASPPTRQPASPSTHQPASPPTHQPINPPTHQPASPSTHQPASPPTNQSKINLLDEGDFDLEEELEEELEEPEVIASISLEEEEEVEKPKQKINLLDTLGMAKPKVLGTVNIKVTIRLTNRGAGSDAIATIALGEDGIGKTPFNFKKTTVSSLFSVLLTTLKPYLPSEE